LLVDRPDHPKTTRARADFDGLGPPPSFSTDERMARAEALSRARRHEEALVELTGREPAGHAMRAQWLHLRGMALYKTRHHYPEAARVLAAAARLGGPTAALDEFHSASAHTRAGETVRAIRAYRRMARRYRRHPRALEAEMLAGWLELGARPNTGRASLERLLRRHLDPDDPVLREALWHLALSDFDRGRIEEAARGFERYAGTGPGAMVRARGLYWLGRARMALGQRSHAIVAYRAAVSVEPLHWYALLARERLEELGEDPGLPFGQVVDLGVPLPVASVAVPPAVAFYASLGLHEDAARLLRAAESALRRADPPNATRSLVSMYTAIGDASRAYRLVLGGAQIALSLPPGPETRWAWDAAYPRPFREEVEEAGRAYRAPPELIYALMRQESGYQSDAVSQADAIGLLQLLPSTARAVAEAAEMELEFQRDLLFDPRVNISLGAAHVGELLVRYSGCAPLAAAAYNGGGHRVAGWLPESGDRELDRFVEGIPYEQTRNYVRRVTSHYARYLFFSAGTGAWPDLIPARVTADARCTRASH
jgi:soluble lytic murein transglycosylase